MESLNNLTGIQFETLCEKLLTEMGFSVESTKASGDGGIDLIASYNAPILKGKYIIQCKRYTGGVGEPIIRDLYGVVMSERANKGVAITTGYFTEKATNFALGKNLELIDGDNLASILDKYKILSLENPGSKKTFLEYECFNSSQYAFYKTEMKDNSVTEEMAHEYLFNHFFNRLTSNASPDELKMVHSGFADEYLKLFDWAMDKFYKHGKNKLAYREILEFIYRDTAALYNFELYSYVKRRWTELKKHNRVQVLNVEYVPDEFHKMYLRTCPDELRLNTFCTSLSGITEAQRNIIYEYTSPLRPDKGYYWAQNWHTTSISEFVKPILQPLEGAGMFLLEFPLARIDGSTSSNTEILNLLSLFTYFEIEEGIRAIDKALFGNVDIPEDWKKAQPPYELAENGPVIRYAEKDTIPTFETYHGGSCIAELDRCEKISLKAYYDEYAHQHQEKIDSEIEKIRMLLKSLE